MVPLEWTNGRPRRSAKATAATPKPDNQLGMRTPFTYHLSEQRTDQHTLISASLTNTGKTNSSHGTPGWLIRPGPTKWSSALSPPHSPMHQDNDDDDVLLLASLFNQLYGTSIYFNVQQNKTIQFKYDLEWNAATQTRCLLWELAYVPMPIADTSN